MLLMMVSAALAGSGPWVPGTGTANLYVGVFGERFTTLKGFGDSVDGGENFDVAEGVANVGVQAIASYGIATRTELEVRVPWQHSNVTRDDHPLCELLGPEACDTTETVGVMEARVKTLVLDELAGAPVSASVAGVVRYGGFTADTRDRLTNAGEGTMDVGGALAVGRSGPMGGGYYATFIDAFGVYRTPTTTTYPQLSGDEKVPGPDFGGQWDLYLNFGGPVSVGPSVTGMWRPVGRDFYDLDFTDRDRFAALKQANLRAGVKLIVNDPKNHAFSVSAFRTVLVSNNPTDTFTVSAGVSFNGLLEGEK